MTTAITISNALSREYTHGKCHLNRYLVVTGRSRAATLIRSNHNRVVSVVHTEREIPENLFVEYKLYFYMKCSLCHTNQSPIISSSHITIAQRSPRWPNYVAYNWTFLFVRTISFFHLMIMKSPRALRDVAATGPQILDIDIGLW